MASYLETIGTLLTEHHFAEARQNALGVKQALTCVYRKLNPNVMMLDPQINRHRR